MRIIFLKPVFHFLESYISYSFKTNLTENNDKIAIYETDYQKFKKGNVPENSRIYFSEKLSYGERKDFQRIERNSRKSFLEVSQLSQSRRDTGIFFV